MKVLFLSQIVPYPPHGGVLQRGYNLLRELGRHARVHLLAFVHPDVLPTEAALEESRRALGRVLRDGRVLPSVGRRRRRCTARRRSRLSAVLDGTRSASSRIGLCRFNGASRRALQRRPLRPGPRRYHRARASSSPSRRPLPSVLTHHNIESMLMERRAAGRDAAAGATVPAARSGEAARVTKRP